MRPIAALLAVLVFSALSFSLANISDCGTLSNPNEDYVLTADINSSASCLTVEYSVENSTLDCEGHSITGEGAGSSRGIELLTSVNVTVRDCVIRNYTDGLYILGLGTPVNHAISNITVSNTTHAVYLTQVGGSTISGITAYENERGIYVVNSFNNSLSGISAYGNIYGIYTNGGEGNNFSDADSYSNDYGAYIAGATGCLFSNASLHGNAYGMILNDSGSSAITNSRAYNNSQYQIYVDGSGSGNLIYNNIFNASGSQGVAYDAAGANAWNTTRTPATSIIGGNYTGGNWYSDYTGTDSDGDGIGDNQPNYSIYGGSNYDYLPLTFYLPLQANVALNSPADGANLTSQDVTLNWTASNFSANPTCNVTRNSTLIFSGTCTNGTNCATANATSDGAYYWNVTCYTAGENATSGTRSFMLDTAPPSVSIQSPANSTYNITTLDLNYTATDPNTDKCWYSLDGGGNISLPGCGNTTLGGLGHASHDVRVYSNDTFGNAGSATAYFTVNLGPVLDYTPGNEQDNAYLDRTWAYFEIDYTEANRENTTLELNGTAYEMQCNSTHCWHNASGLPEGYYIYNATMNNSGGYNTTAPSRNFTVDTTLPAIAINSPPGGSVLGSRTITVNVTATDANFNYTDISIVDSGGATVNSTTSTVNGNFAVQLGVPSDAVYNITATAYDLAGNSNTTTNPDITVDSAAPVVAIQSPINATYNASSVRLNFTAGGTGSEVSACWYSLDGGNNTTLINCANRTITPGDGPHTITVYANDSAGNIGSAGVSFTFNRINSVIRLTLRNQDVKQALLTAISLDGDYLALEPGVLFAPGQRKTLAMESVRAYCSYTGQPVQFDNVTLYYAQGQISNLAQAGSVPLTIRCS